MSKASVTKTLLVSSLLLSGGIGLTLAQDDPSFFTAAKQDDVVDDYDPDFDDQAADYADYDYDGGDFDEGEIEADPDNGDGDYYDGGGGQGVLFDDNVYDQVVQAISDNGGLLSDTGDDDYWCYPTDGTDVEWCIEQAQGEGKSKLVLAATDDTNYFYVDQQVKLPQNFIVTGELGDNGELLTWITASDEVSNGCSSSYKETGGIQEFPGDSSTRQGFVLNDNTWIGNFNFVALDTDRWQGYGGDPLCGGAVFEAPGCADAYCDPNTSSEDITNREGEARGISTAGVGNVFITGDNYGDYPDGYCSPSWNQGGWYGDITAPQSAVYLPRVRDYDNGHYNIDISGITMYKSWADGINVHGSNSQISVHDNDLACQGDDSLAVWSTQDNYSAKGIQFYNNKLDQRLSTNPNPEWGSCIALYGGGGEGDGQAIWIDRNYCQGNTRVEDVKFSKHFRDEYLDADGINGPMFPWGSQVFVTNYGGDNKWSDTTCGGANYDWDGEGLPKEVVINMCPNPTGWADCPAPAFLYSGCGFDGNWVDWFDYGPDSFGNAPGYYCTDGSDAVDPGSIDDLMPACITKGCSTIIWRDDWQMYVCNDVDDPNDPPRGLTYDACYIQGGCDASQTEFYFDQSSDDGGYWHCNQNDPWSDDMDQVEACYVDSYCKWKKVDGEGGLKWVDMDSDESQRIQTELGLRSPFEGWTCAQ